MFALKIRSDNGEIIHCWVSSPAQIAKFWDTVKTFAKTHLL